jgi:hypothetical protein
MSTINIEQAKLVASDVRGQVVADVELISRIATSLRRDGGE